MMLRDASLSHNCKQLVSLTQQVGCVSNTTPSHEYEENILRVIVAFVPAMFSTCEEYHQLLLEIMQSLSRIWNSGTYHGMVERSESMGNYSTFHWGRATHFGYHLVPTQVDPTYFKHYCMRRNYIFMYVYTGSSKKMVGKLNRYNFCSMPDRKFYPSSF